MEWRSILHGFHWVLESNWFCIALPKTGLKKLAPLVHPIEVNYRNQFIFCSDSLLGRTKPKVVPSVILLIQWQLWMPYTIRIQIHSQPNETEAIWAKFGQVWHKCLTKCFGKLSSQFIKIPRCTLLAFT